MLPKPGVGCAGVTHPINAVLPQRDLPQYRAFGQGHSCGIPGHSCGREAGPELREDVGTVLEPGMVISMAPMLTIPEGRPGAAGYREHDILIRSEDGAEDITGYPCGPGHNVV